MLVVRQCIDHVLTDIRDTGTLDLNRHTGKQILATPFSAKSKVSMLTSFGSQRLSESTGAAISPNAPILSDDEFIPEG